MASKLLTHEVPLSHEGTTMHVKTHPYFLEETEITLAQNEARAQKAQLENLLLEFEHSEEYRGCARGYLQTPRVILEDFIAETGLSIDAIDTEFLLHELLVVIPSRMLGLVKEDAHQILREQLCFWSFAHSQWQLQYAEDCLEVLKASVLQKLLKIMSLAQDKKVRQKDIRLDANDGTMGQPFECENNFQWDQDVYPLNQHIPF